MEESFFLPNLQRTGQGKPFWNFLPLIEKLVNLKE